MNEYNKIFFVGLLLAFLTATVHSQSISYRSLVDNNSITQLSLPQLDNDALLETELKLRRKGRANHFAQARDVDISTVNKGSWHAKNNGYWVWRTAIESKNAISLNLGFTSFYLPGSASFYIINGHTDEKLGPFTKADNDDHAQLWTPIIDSDLLILELYVHERDKDQVQLTLSRVNHAFTDFKSGAGSSSGSCNLDVVCGAADGYEIVDDNRDIIQSVGGYTLNGIAQCSGVLINNTSNNCVPYFLTARHCNIDDDNSPSMVVYWNYENSTCRIPDSIESGNSGDGSLDFFNSGAIVRVTYEPSDVSLVELDDPVDPTTGPFFAGWNKTGDLTSSSICIHHPNVEEKRISFDLDSLTYERDEQDEIIGLMVNDWDIGTTEGGSSGAPLFNEKKQIIGQLRGGQASCGNDLFDFYGAFFQSWEGSNTPETALKFWLDPNNTDLEEIDGKFCSFVVSASETRLEYCNSITSEYTFDVGINENFSGNVNLEVITDLDSLTADIASNPVSPGDSTSIRLSNLDLIDKGIYTIIVRAQDDTDESSVNFTLVVVDSPPTDVEPLFPSANDEDINPISTFSWSSFGDTFDVQVSTSESFDTLLIDSVDMDKSTLEVDNLSAATQYYWRIRAGNICGKGSWTDPISFSTGNVNCYKIFANDLPKGIGESIPVTVTSDIYVPFGGVMTKLSLIEVSGEHTWVSDLTMKIKNPQGDEITLIENNCIDEDDFNLSFSDEALEQVPCPYNTGGKYRPANSMLPWLGSNPQGTWTFTVMDDFAQDGGRFDRWGIQICVEFSDDISIVSEKEIYNICFEDNLDIDVYVGEGFGEDYMLSAVSDLPSDLIDLGDLDSLELGNNSIVLDGLLSAPAGEYRIEISVADSLNEANQTIVIRKETGPIATSLISPTDGELDIEFTPTFVWFNDNDDVSRSIEISLDTSFIDLLIKEDIEGDTYTLIDPLEESTEYFWRILSSSDCGVIYSEIFSFFTDNDVAVFEIGGRQFDVFPNPVSEYFVIQSDKSDIPFTYYMYDTQGKQIEMNASPLGSNKYQVDVSDLPKGVYILKVDVGDNTFVDKIIVQR